MKSLSRILAVLGAAFCLAQSARAFDMGPSQLLDRYTITNNAVRHEQGFLKATGQFNPFLSEIESPYLYDSIYDFAAVSGRPLMPEYLFDGYKASGALPNWVRSRDSFTIGLSKYVIVAVKGKGDPDPVPTILEQPESDRVLAGDSADFFIIAIPWSASYQWYFRDKPIPGATDFGLEIPHVTKADAGLYNVKVSLGGKSLASKKVMLTVVEPVALKTQPKSQTVKAGKNFTLTVTATGTPPFTYEWYWNGRVITNATKSFLTISKATTNNSGKYWVFVDNGLSWAASSTAVVTVTP